MSASLETLLAPISAEQPCGPDLTYDPRLDAIEKLCMGTPEVEMGSVVRPAEPPDWRAVEEACEEFLGASKHLRIATIWAVARTRRAGYEGLRDGLQLLVGLVTQHWAAVHPLLDPEDNNDPLMRLNILSTITARRLGVTGWLQMIDFVYHAPLFKLPAGPVSLDIVQTARTAASAPAADPAADKEPAPAPSGPDWHAIEPAIRGMPIDELKAQAQVIDEARAELGKLDEFLTATLGGKDAISFDELDKVLALAQTTYKPFIEVVPEETGGAPTAEGATSEPAGAGHVPGAIRNRDDVIRALDAICTFYAQSEPSSPVPIILTRARKMVTMNFVELMAELALANADTLKPSMGSALPPSAG